jgi:peptide/nickel transport system substrate-binding protein
LSDKTGSSILGLFKSFLLTEYDTGQKDASATTKRDSRVWSSNAIEKVDDYTIRLNGLSPQLAVRENLSTIRP